VKRQSWVGKRGVNRDFFLSTLVKTFEGSAFLKGEGGRGVIGRQRDALSPFGGFLRKKEKEV